MRSPRIRGIIEAAVVAGLCYLTGRLGLLLALPPGFATPTWPPAGIAFGAVMVLGPRVWPGIWLGSLLANLSVGLPLGPEALGLGACIATGSTLAALAHRRMALWLAGAVHAGQDLFARNRGVLAFFASACVCWALAATVGAGALALFGFIGLAELPRTWLTWWLGDLGGVVAFGTLLLVWAKRLEMRPTPGRVIEAVCLVLALVASSVLVFGAPDWLWGDIRPFAFPVLPVLLWAAISFEARGATAANLLLSAVAIYYTLRGEGPFEAPTRELALLPLQLGAVLINLTMLSVAAAVTERRQARAEIERLNADLEARVRERTAELEAVTKRLLEADRYKDEFLSVISHELRTPLNFITGFGSILHDELEGPLNPRQHSHLERILAGADRMLSLVNDLLDIARIRAGELTVVRQIVDMQGLVATTLASHAPEARDRGVMLETTIAEPWEVVGDEARLAQILDNLITNALKFTPNGGRISFSAERDGPSVTVRVADSGPGVPPEDRERIFERFRQGDMSSTRPKGGVGLGLAICRALIEAQGGRIGVTGDGPGSVFWFTVPAADRSAEEAAAPGVSRT